LKTLPKVPLATPSVVMTSLQETIACDHEKIKQLQQAIQIKMKQLRGWRIEGDMAQKSVAMRERLLGLKGHINVGLTAQEAAYLNENFRKHGVHIKPDVKTRFEILEGEVTLAAVPIADNHINSPKSKPLATIQTAENNENSDDDDDNEDDDDDANVKIPNKLRDAQDVGSSEESGSESESIQLGNQQRSQSELDEDDE
jgi:hypothetical protein